ncbi:unnamed protein product [Ectocarpus sp. 8 AP-2014]
MHGRRGEKHRKLTKPPPLAANDSLLGLLLYGSTISDESMAHAAAMLSSDQPFNKRQPSYNQACRTSLSTVISGRPICVVSYIFIPKQIEASTLSRATLPSTPRPAPADRVSVILLSSRARPGMIMSASAGDHLPMHPPSASPQRSQAPAGRQTKKARQNSPSC